MRNTLLDIIDMKSAVNVNYEVEILNYKEYLLISVYEENVYFFIIKMMEIAYKLWTILSQIYTHKLWEILSFAFRI